MNRHAERQTDGQAQRHDSTEGGTEMGTETGGEHEKEVGEGEREVVFYVHPTAGTPDGGGNRCDISHR